MDDFSDDDLGDNYEKEILGDGRYNCKVLRDFNANEERLMRRYNRFDKWPNVFWHSNTCRKNAK